MDFSKTSVKQAILSQKSSKNRAKSPKKHRLYHKTYVSYIGIYRIFATLPEF